MKNSSRIQKPKDDSALKKTVLDRLFTTKNLNKQSDISKFVIVLNFTKFYTCKRIDHARKAWVTALLDLVTESRKKCKIK